MRARVCIRFTFAFCYELETLIVLWDRWISGLISLHAVVFNHYITAPTAMGLIVFAISTCLC